MTSLTVKLVGHNCSQTRFNDLQQFLYEHGYQESDSADYHLHCYQDYLELEDQKHPDKLCMKAEFLAGKMNWRRQQAELLHRAIGISEQNKPDVIDATAGIGRDAFVLANRGCRVTLLERHPVIYLLLQDGLGRAQQAKDPGALRMRAIHTDAITYLGEIETSPDVVYLDPMFPETRKSAKTKKEMQMFRSMLGAYSDDQQLLEKAQHRASHRVVVKRPVKAPDYAGIKPNHTLNGKNIRFDIYTNKAF